MNAEPDALAFDEAVKGIYDDYVELVRILEVGSSPAGLVAINRSYHKHLLVAAASSLESRVKKLVPEIFKSRGSTALGTFVAKAVMARNYHTLFDWKAENAFGFFSSFGDECGKNFKSLVKAEDSLKRQHEAFMRLGNLRNLVVHNDYAAYSVDLTPAEVIELYRNACAFVDRIETLALFETEGLPDRGPAA